MKQCSVSLHGSLWRLLDRNGLIFLIESSSTCWAIAVNDYGTIISSVLALLTFAGLTFVVYMMQRTLSSKTPQHRARHPAADKQRRKKRKQKVKGRIRPPQQNDSHIKDDEEESADDLLKQAVEPPSLPPLVEDKPVLETIITKTPAPSVKTDAGWSSDLRDSFDSSFEDSSCETSVSSASVATPNRLPQTYPEHQVSVHENNNSQQTAKVPTNSTLRGHGGMHLNSDETRRLSVQGEAPESVTRSRWDALKPASRPERYNPAPRTTRHGRNEARSNRRGRKQNPKPFSSSFTSADDPPFRRHPLIPKTTSMSHTVAQKPAPCTEEDKHKEHLEMELNPESPPWNPISAASTTVLAPPPGLDRIHSNEIPFGCGSSDGGNSSLPFKLYQEVNANNESVNPEDRSFFGAIGPSIPSVDKAVDYTNSYLDESFTSAAISFRSSTKPYSGNPFEPYGNSDDDKIEAQLQELGGQMVGSILDF